MRVGFWIGLFFVFSSATIGGSTPQFQRVTDIDAAGGGAECAVEFEDAEFFIEINATDGDAGGPRAARAVAGRPASRAAR